MDRKDAEAAPLSWWQIVGGGIALLASVATIYGIGYSFGKDSNDTLVNILREKNQTLENTEKTLRAEIESTKIELKGAQSLPQAIRNPEPLTIPKTLSPSSNRAPVSAIAPLNPAPNTAITQTVSVGRGETIKLFGGELFITVQGLKFEYDPVVRYRVIGSIGAKGQPNKDFGGNGAEAGAVFVYHGFEIRILKTETFNAEFMATRIQSKT